MANEDFQKLIVEKLASIEAAIKNVEANTLTKADLNQLDVNLSAKIDELDTKVEQYGQAQQDDVKGLLELIDKKLNRIVAAQVTQGESIHILALRQLQTEAELAALKKAPR